MTTIQTASAIRASIDTPTQWGVCEECDDQGFIYNAYAEFDPAIHTPIRCGCGAPAPAVVRFIWAVSGAVEAHATEQAAAEAVGAFIVRASKPPRLFVAPAHRQEWEPRARCICETSPECLQVYFADRFNEALGMATVDDLGNVTPAQDAREVPVWVRLVAERVEGECKAALHYTNVTLDEWLGMNVTTQDDPTKRERLEQEDQARLLTESLTDAARPRWTTEYDSYESQDEFIARLTTERRSMLIRLLHAIGADPNGAETVAWVQEAIETKHGNKLRGYARCIAQLRGQIERGQITVAA